MGSETFLCSICFEHPMIDPLTMSCCGNAVCRHCYVRHLEAHLVHPRCPCCGTKLKCGIANDKIPPVSVPLRAAIERECAEKLALRVERLPQEDKGDALAQRIKSVEDRRFVAETHAARQGAVRLAARARAAGINVDNFEPEGDGDLTFKEKVLAGLVALFLCLLAILLGYSLGFTREEMGGLVQGLGTIFRAIRGFT